MIAFQTTHAPAFGLGKDSLIFTTAFIVLLPRLEFFLIITDFLSLFAEDARRRVRRRPNENIAAFSPRRTSVF